MTELGKVRVEQTLLFAGYTAFASVMEEAGVPIIAHKGAILAELVYERPEDRPMVDIDVIFRPGQWRQVREALRARGYRLPQGSDESFWLENYFNLTATAPAPGKSSFDLHWGLTQEGRYHIDTEDLFACAIPYTSSLAGGRAMLRLPTEELLLSLFLHLAYHYFESRLLWLYDMKRIIESQSPDWVRLRSRAAAWGLSTVVALNVAYLDKVFPGVVPREASSALRAGALRRAVLRPMLSPQPRSLFRADGNRLAQFVVGLAAIDRPADMLRFAAGKVARTLRWAGRRPEGH